LTGKRRNESLSHSRNWPDQCSSIWCPEVVAVVFSLVLGACCCCCPPRVECLNANHLSCVQPFADRRLLNFTAAAIRSIFGGFALERDTVRFHNRMRLYSSNWCCNRDEPRPRAVEYDLLWDIKYHIDKFGRNWTSPWSADGPSGAAPQTN
jgi:hypothetical protein